MAGVNDALLADLPVEVRELLTTAPVTDKKLLELDLAWSGLSDSQARMVEALRLFVITWDPLESRAGRPRGFATVNVGAPGLELAVYVPVWSLVESASEREVTVAAVLGSMAGSAITTAAAHEQFVTARYHPDLAAQRVVPDLLADVATGAAMGPVTVRLKSAGWEDIGLGAITDVVQHAFGPVDLDRSPVELAGAARPRLGCPACEGRRFGFPGELADVQQGMCAAHQREAQKVINTRFARANASNPDGWTALTGASQRLGRPHLPNGLATKLAESTGSEELAICAGHIVDAASWFPGRPEDLAMAFGEEELLAGLPDGLATLISDLGRAGFGAEAVEVADALERVDPDNRAQFAGDITVALAKAGLDQQARARIEASVSRWPDDFRIRVLAADALRVLGDLDATKTQLDTALSIARQADDRDGQRDLTRRLKLIRGGKARDERGGQRPQPQRKPSKAQRKRKR